MSNWQMWSFFAFLIGGAEIIWGLYGYVTQANNSPSVESRFVSGIFFMAVSYFCFRMYRREPRKTLTQEPQKGTAGSPIGCRKETALFNSSEVLKSARAAHEQLESWVEILLFVLNEQGVTREQASLRMAALLEKMEAVSNRFPPAIVSLTLTFLLNLQVEQICRTQEKPNSELAARIREAVTGLGDGLVALLKEEGWQKDEVISHASALSNELIEVSKESGALIAALTVAVTLDNYVKYLIKETVLPYQTP